MGKNLTIYATSQSDAPKIGSVKISVPGFGSRLENVEPFALFGDNGKGDFLGGKKLPDGTHTVTMTAFEGAKGTGAVLETVTFDFTVADGNGVSVNPTPDPEPVVVVPAPEPKPEPETDLDRDAPAMVDSNLLNVSLIDTGTDTVITDLFSGMKLSARDLANRDISISAEALNGVSGIGSVRLNLDDTYSRLENIAPYALFGDNGKGNFGEGEALSKGMHTATLTAYSGKKGTGSILEEITIQFEVGGYDRVVIDREASAVSSYSKSQDTGTASFSNDISGITLEGSAWKTLTLFKEITKMTVMKFEYESKAEGEIQGIGLSNGKDELGSTFFQVGGTQDLGIQDFNDYVTGSGTNTYVIPIGEFFTGEFDKLVLINDDDAGLGSSSTFDNISFYEAVA